MSTTKQDENPEGIPGGNAKSSIKKSPGADGLVISVTGRVDELIVPQEEVNEDIEVKRGLLLNKLDDLGSKLGEAMELYHSMFGQEFGYIDAASMNIEYADENILKSLNLGNIEARALFGGFDPEDIKSVALYNDLLARLKQENKTIQAHLLGYIELLSVFVINGKDSVNQALLDEDGFRAIIFRNPRISSNYQALIKRLFDLMDTEPGTMIDISKLLHRKNGKDLNSVLSTTARHFMRKFE